MPANPQPELTAEQLETAAQNIAVGNIRGHLNSIKFSHETLRQRAEAAERERDALKAQLESAPWKAGYKAENARAVKAEQRIAALKAWLENELAVSETFGASASDLKVNISARAQGRPWNHGVQGSQWAAEALRAVLATLQEPR